MVIFFIVMFQGLGWVVSLYNTAKLLCMPPEKYGNTSITILLITLT
ncbi:hypothetical protein MTR67_023007 [Solanum verrucosum]|uniref:Uncharacterized protein n=1 Tax=Solanum verrucosum TaxID=315347 RepID=A0AAF0QSR3_SOLVR|nr:hypothetical protein MTR67_023007 [Solanum verrucosum]